MAVLNGVTAIITGGGQGIGRAYCHRFAAEGATVYVADVAADAAERVAGEVVANGGRALAVTVDVSVKASVDRMVERVLSDRGQIDVLVNNAAIQPQRPFLSITEEEWDRVMAVNLKGVFLCSQSVARHMIIRKKGKIINIASDAIWTIPVFAHYVAAKGGVVGLTRAMARELGPHGINVNAIAPGLTATEITRPIVDRSPELRDFYDFTRRVRSIQRDEVPEDLVGTAVFLASADSDFITGQTLLVEGGRTFR